jgi:hypothetical protein
MRVVIIQNELTELKVANGAPFGADYTLARARFDSAYDQCVVIGGNRVLAFKIGAVIAYGCSYDMVALIPGILALRVLRFGAGGVSATAQTATGVPHPSTSSSFATLYSCSRPVAKIQLIILPATATCERASLKDAPSLTLCIGKRSPLFHIVLTP